MKENLELLEHIYQDAEMASYTIQTLLKDLKEKDNKIKSVAEDILKEYQSWQEKAKEKLQEQGAEIKKQNMFAKMGANMGIQKEVKKDNSDANMADMLIQGMAMGTLEMEKKIKNYKNEVSKEELKLAQFFLEFQENSIEKLKFFL